MTYKSLCKLILCCCFICSITGLLAVPEVIPSTILCKDLYLLFLLPQKLFSVVTIQVFSSFDSGVCSNGTAYQDGLPMTTRYKITFFPSSLKFLLCSSSSLHMSPCDLLFFAPLHTTPPPK